MGDRLDVSKKTGREESLQERVQVGLKTFRNIVKATLPEIMRVSDPLYRAIAASTCLEVMQDRVSRIQSVVGCQSIGDVNFDELLELVSRSDELSGGEAMDLLVQLENMGKVLVGFHEHELGEGFSPQVSFGHMQKRLSVLQQQIQGVQKLESQAQYAKQQQMIQRSQPQKQLKSAENQYGVAMEMNSRTTGGVSVQPLIDKSQVEGDANNQQQQPQQQQQQQLQQIQQPVQQTIPTTTISSENQQKAENASSQVPAVEWNDGTNQQNVAVTESEVLKDQQEAGLSTDFQNDVPYQKNEQQQIEQQNNARFDQSYEQKESFDQGWNQSKQQEETFQKETGWNQGGKDGWGQPSTSGDQWGKVEPESRQKSSPGSQAGSQGEIGDFQTKQQVIQSQSSEPKQSPKNVNLNPNAACFESHISQQQSAELQLAQQSSSAGLNPDAAGFQQDQSQNVSQTAEFSSKVTAEWQAGGDQGQPEKTGWEQQNQQNDDGNQWGEDGDEEQPEKVQCGDELQQRSQDEQNAKSGWANEDELSQQVEKIDSQDWAQEQGQDWGQGGSNQGRQQGSQQGLEEQVNEQKFQEQQQTYQGWQQGQVQGASQGQNMGNNQGWQQGSDQGWGDSQGQSGKVKNWADEVEQEEKDQELNQTMQFASKQEITGDNSGQKCQENVGPSYHAADDGGSPGSQTFEEDKGAGQIQRQGSAQQSVTGPDGNNSGWNNEQNLKQGGQQQQQGDEGWKGNSNPALQQSQPSDVNYQSISTNNWDQQNNQSSDKQEQFQSSGWALKSEQKNSGWEQQTHSQNNNQGWGEDTTNQKVSGVGGWEQTQGWGQAPNQQKSSQQNSGNKDSGWDTQPPWEQPPQQSNNQGGDQGWGQAPNQQKSSQQNSGWDTQPPLNQPDLNNNWEQPAPNQSKSSQQNSGKQGSGWDTQPPQNQANQKNNWEQSTSKQGVDAGGQDQPQEKGKILNQKSGWDQPQLQPQPQSSSIWEQGTDWNKSGGNTQGWGNQQQSNQRNNNKVGGRSGNQDWGDKGSQSGDREYSPQQQHRSTSRTSSGSGGRNPQRNSQGGGRRQSGGGDSGSNLGKNNWDNSGMQQVQSSTSWGIPPEEFDYENTGRQQQSRPQQQMQGGGGGWNQQSQFKGGRSSSGNESQGRGNNRDGGGRSQGGGYAGWGEADGW